MKPLLENDILTCAHNGIVQLKSNLGADLNVDGAGVITKSDLLNAAIIGCSNNIAGIPKPCLKIAQIPPNALSQNLLVNDEEIVLEDMISSILTDNSVPLQMPSKKEKSLEVD